MSKVNYGLLGAGMMGQEHIKNIALLDNAEVVAFVEPDPTMQQHAATLIPNAKILDNLDALLEESLDALVIATPNYQHVEQLLEVMKKTQLPILVEKPIATHLEQVKTLQAAFKNYGAPIWVAMEYRYMPPVVEFRQQVAAGVLGELSMLSIREHRFPFLEKVNDWNRFNAQTGGTLVEKCCHFFDLMRLLINSEAVRVYASAGQDHNHLDESYNGQTPDIIDNAYVIVDFANGKRAMLDLNMFAEGSRFQEEICAVGEKAKLECFVPGPGRFWPKDLGEPPVAKVIFSPRNPKGPIGQTVPVDETLLEAGDHNGSTFYQHQKFYDVIIKNRSIEVDINDGLKAVVIGLAAQHSAKIGQAVTLTHQGLNYNE